MKQKLLMAAALLLSWSAANAQGVLEASKYSQTDLRGTARSMSMGGAFGALGGDITAISINPAGIGIYKSSEIVTTLDFQNVETKATSSFEEIKKNKFNVNFNNFAFVGTFPLYNDVAPLINFGFSYNRVKSFNKKYSMRGSGANNWTLSDYIADRSGGYKPGDLDLTDLSQAQADDMWKYEDWLPIFGQNGSLMKHDGDKFVSSTAGMDVGNALFVEEKGSVNKYDFNVGTTFADMLSAGLTVSVTDLDYRLYSKNTEDYYDKGLNAGGGYDLYNDLKTEGTGWQLGLGVIFKPIHELRIGIAYQSPTWYNMTDHYYAELNDDFAELKNAGHANFQNYTEAGWVKSMDGDFWNRTEYKLRTPDKWTFSLAGVLGTNAIISLDYELVDYKKAKFQDRDGRNAPYNDVNQDVKNFYKLTSNLRVGGEYRITPQFSGRIGYSWQQSPYSDKFEKIIDSDLNKNGVFDTTGSVPHYVIGKDTHYITWGLGYRFTRNFYTDLAFVYKTQKGDLYTHSMSDKTKLTEDSMQGALTLGFKF